MNCCEDIYLYYISEIGKVALLSRKEEYDLATLARQGNDKAKQKLIVANLRFTVLMARRYTRSGIPLMDLISEGNLGLMRAVDTFDPERGFHFISYAVHWIKQSIIKSISEKSRILSIPLHLNNLLKTIERDLEGEYTDKSVESLAKRMRMSKYEIIKLISIANGHVSLDYELSDSIGGSITLHDLLGDDKTAEPMQTVIDNELQSKITTLLRGLRSIEADVIRYRYGLDKFPALTLQEIGKKNKVSKERIRQIEKKALIKLKNASNIKEFYGFQTGSNLIGNRVSAGGVHASA